MKQNGKRFHVSIVPVVQQLVCIDQPINTIATSKRAIELAFENEIKSENSQLVFERSRDSFVVSIVKAKSFATLQNNEVPTTSTWSHSSCRFHFHWAPDDYDAAISHAPLYLTCPPQAQPLPRPSADSCSSYPTSST